MRLATFRSHPADLHLVIGSPGEGFIALDQGLVVIDESEVLSRPPRPRAKHKKPPADAALKSWRDLRPGDIVVHLSHGVGRYVGLKQIAVSDGPAADVLELEYADKSTMFVPVDKLHLVSKHQGGDGAPTLDKLGGIGQAAWTRRNHGSRRPSATSPTSCSSSTPSAKRPAAKRSPRPTSYTTASRPPSPATRPPTSCAPSRSPFPDMERPRPMDRLVCGDVGFGKTEVAMRAAFKAVARRQAGRAAGADRRPRRAAPPHLPAPPARMARSASPTSRRCAPRARTRRPPRHRRRHGRHRHRHRHHRILSKDVEIPRLGLVIIDEEHRFGVAQKETLKGLRPDVDVLTLTATPIPRTLHLSMLGLRDISLIQTPPVDRLADPHRRRPAHRERHHRRHPPRARPRRPGLLPAQPRLGHRQEGRAHPGASCPRPASPSATARWTHAPARKGDGPLRAPARPTCSCARPSSRAASTSRTPTPSSSTAPTASAWPSSTSCAVASVARAPAPTATCSCPRPMASRATRPSGSAPSSASRSSAAATRSRPTTSTSAAPATSSAPTRPATSTRSATTPTWTCCPRRSARSAPIRPTPRSRPSSTSRSRSRSTPASPTTGCPRPPFASASTARLRAPRRTTSSPRPTPSRSTATVLRRSRSRTSPPSWP